MNATRNSLFSALMILLLPPGAFPQAPAFRPPPPRIHSMKLLTPDTGWAVVGKKLVWITRDGASWKDITPVLKHKRQSVSSVFFLDTLRGWVVLNCGDDIDPKVDDVCFEFASTTNAGRTWSVVHPKIVDPVANPSDIEDGLGFSDNTFVDFADPQRGWAILTKGTHLQTCSGFMLRTVDGGHTWTHPASGGTIAGCVFHFVTPNDGWTTGRSEEGPDLYVTHDAGKTWKTVLVAPPPSVKVEKWPPPPYDAWPFYELPIFQNPGHGFLIGSYGDGSKSTTVLFSTTNLGRTWKFERVLPSTEGVTTILHDVLITVSISDSMNKLTLTRLQLLGETSSPTAVTADVHGMWIKHHGLADESGDAINMVSDSHGWLLADTLLSTADGGATWKDITPW
jgi:photosystem II stability/assembly factor-like uncharacterized protein